jgi:hypothetical protein
MAAYPASDAMTDARYGANSQPDVQQHASPSCPRRSFSYPHDTTYGRATTDTSHAPVGGMARYCGGAVLERRSPPWGKTADRVHFVRRVVGGFFYKGAMP